MATIQKIHKLNNQNLVKQHKQIRAQQLFVEMRDRINCKIKQKKKKNSQKVDRQLRTGNGETLNPMFQSTIRAATAAEGHQFSFAS